MANEVQIDRNVRGQPLEEYIMRVPGVAAAVHAAAIEIEGQAEERMQPFRFDDFTFITVARMKTVTNGWLVLMIDPQHGYEGAIEFGRRDYLTEDSPEAQRKGFRIAETTRKVAPKVYKHVAVLRHLNEVYGGMDGIRVLRDAVKHVKAVHRRDFR